MEIKRVIFCLCSANIKAPEASDFGCFFQFYALCFKELSVLRRMTHRDNSAPSEVAEDIFGAELFRVRVKTGECLVKEESIALGKHGAH